MAGIQDTRSQSELDSQTHADMCAKWKYLFATCCPTSPTTHTQRLITHLYLSIRLLLMCVRPSASEPGWVLLCVQSHMDTNWLTSLYKETKSAWTSAAMNILSNGVSQSKMGPSHGPSGHLCFSASQFVGKRGESAAGVSPNWDRNARWEQTKRWRWKWMLCLWERESVHHCGCNTQSSAVAMTTLQAKWVSRLLPHPCWHGN